MISLTARRLMLAVVTLFIISLIIFVGVEALPGDMATAYLGQFATPESLKALREEFDLDAPAHERYFNWLGNAIRGDLGESYARHKPVSELIGYRFRNTVVLSTAATLVGVPLATLGGFLALRLVYLWSVVDRYMPIQNLDVLTMLGFIILIGVVVNNAILIVHQALNFMSGVGDNPPLPARKAISESVKTRVRPIFMSMLTSLGGMLPLVLMPGSGSELYRGLGGVVIGGLVVSTIFTLFLVPALFSLTLDARAFLLRQGQRLVGSGERTI